MDTVKAREVLSAELEPYRALSYDQLAARIGDLDAHEVPNPGRHPYQIEIEVTWDARPGGDIRVLGAIDDGGWSAFKPLCDDFLVTREGHPA